jgi:predicted ATPase
MLPLNRLGRSQVAELVQELAGKALLDSEIVGEIVERTDGIPLFVEELTKAVLESTDQDNQVARVLSASPAPTFAVPTTLHASLVARLDRLGSVAKEVGQIGSVLGRTFDYELIRRVAQIPELALIAALDRLADAGLLLRRGTSPEASYLFNHALVQDAAYSTLLRRRRRELHGQIARVLNDDLGVAGSQPELLAHHHTEAGQPWEASIYWAKAGHRSAARGAMMEAAAQFQKGLEQLKLLPEDRVRWRQELELLAPLGMVMQATSGNASAERGSVYARARQLWEELDFPSEFVHLPYGQALFHVYRGELEMALDLGQDLLRRSERRGDAPGLILAHHSLGQNLMIAGRFRESQSHLREVPQLYSQVSRQEVIDLAGIDPLSAAHSILAIVLFCLGYPDQALEQLDGAIEEAQAMGILRRAAATLTFGCRLLSVSGDNLALSKRAEQLFELATEGRYPSWGAEAVMYRGWAKVNDGDVEGGIALLKRGAADYRACSNEAGMSHYISLLAQALATGGRIDEALPLLEDALRIVERTGEGRFLAELHRHKGEFLRKRSETQAAEEEFFKALEIAREQQAKMWELRAATSLGRVWTEQGRRIKAAELLAPIYSWFSEGFRHPDLIAARSLIDEIG